MSLADALQAASENRARPGGRCTLGALLLTLNGEDRDVLAEWLADDRNTSTIIAAGLQADGHRIGANVVARHRRKDCQCR